MVSLLHVPSAHYLWGRFRMRISQNPERTLFQVHEQRSLYHRELAVHQHGQEPVAELGEVLVFLFKQILAFKN